VAVSQLMVGRRGPEALQNALNREKVSNPDSVFNATERTTANMERLNVVVGANF
jgi:hypothetical protein